MQATGAGTREGQGLVRVAEPAVPTPRMFDRVVFPAAGRYDFQLLAAGQLRKACSIHVLQGAQPK